MTSERNELPECGILPHEAFGTPDAWREAMHARQERLVVETARILGEHSDALDIAEQLNRLYAPFNTFDGRGDLSNHLIAVPRGSDSLHIQFHDGDLDYDVPMDHRVLERHAEVWWLDDVELPESIEPNDLHESAALECLGLVWWGSEEMIDKTIIGKEWEAYEDQ